MVDEMIASTEQDDQSTGETGGISAAQVREHKLFKQLTKQIAERDARLAKIQEDQEETSRARALQAEVEKGNYSAALAQLESAKAAEVERYKRQTEKLAAELEHTRISTKLIASGAVSEKVSGFLANEYLAQTADERPPIEKWIDGIKDSADYASFFAQSQKVTSPADRSGSTATRSGNANAKQYQEWMQNPRTCTPAQLQEAISYHARYVSQNGKSPW